ncbi:MAG: hypothetical protein WBA74_05885, partial [Cyclobacteriaceae bacterium]
MKNTFDNSLSLLRLIKRTYVSSMLIALAIVFYSCEQEDLNTARSSPEQLSSVSSNELRADFAKILAPAVAEHPALRALIKKEALLLFDKDYDVLYHMIKDKPLYDNQTVREVLLQYADEDQLLAIERNLPLMTIFVPTVPNFSPESWNTETEIPEVAVVITGMADVPSYNAEGEEKIIEAKYIPGYPILVIKTNERVRLSTDKSLTVGRSSTNSFFSSDTHSFNFLDDSFDPSIQEAPQEERSIKNPDPRLLTAYETNAGWHRDYIYYGLTPTTPRGELKNNYSETITSFGFMSNVDPMTAYQKISDQTGDPKINGAKNGSSAAIWTEGFFEFRVNILINAQNGLGQNLLKIFPARGSDLFNVTYRKLYPFFNIYVIDQVTLRSFNPNIEILPWDLQNYGMAWKFTVQEWDPDQVITETTQLTSTFAANFELNPTFGIFEKVGLKFGASNTTTRQETFIFRTTVTS